MPCCRADAEMKFIASILEKRAYIHDPTFLHYSETNKRNLEQDEKSKGVLMIVNTCQWAYVQVFKSYRILPVNEINLQYPSECYEYCILRIHPYSLR